VPDCRTYAATTLRPIAPLSLPALEKARLVAGMYLQQSNLYQALRGVYIRTRLRVARTVVLPAWSWERDRIGPLGSMSMLDAVASDLSRARHGDFIMAHLLMPHFPYVYDANCGLRLPKEWLERWDRDAPAGAINTPDSRATQYGRYFEQASCVLKKLDKLMTAIPPSLRHDAIIIIHGDHGSRLPLIAPVLPGGSRLSASDYADSYSTLFAVRSPHIAAGYDRRVAPITCLMRRLVDSGFRSLSALEECAAPPTVFMWDDRGRTFAMPLPAFGQDLTDIQAADTTGHVAVRQH
jgi:hypothetical protein